MHRSPTRAGRLPAAALLGLCLLGGACAPGAPSDPQGLVVVSGGDPGASRPRPNFHDFGAVPVGERVEHVFELLNTDPEPVDVLRVSPTCSCASATIEALLPDGRRVQGDPLDPERVLRVPAGARVAVTFAVDASRVAIKNQDKLVAIRLVTDSPNAAFVQIEAHLISISPFELVPDNVEFGFVSTTTGDARQVDLVRISTTTDGSPLDERPVEAQLHPTGEVLVDEPVRAQLFADPESPLHTWKLVVEVPAGTPRGRYQGTVTIPTRQGLEPGGAAGPALRLPYSARVEGDLLLEPNQFLLRPGPRGDVSPRSVVVTALDRSAFRITAAELDGDGRERLRLEYEPLAADSDGRSHRWRVELSAPEGLGGSGFGGSLRLLLDGAPLETLDVPYVGIVP